MLGAAVIAAFLLCFCAAFVPPAASAKPSLATAFQVCVNTQNVYARAWFQQNGFVNSFSPWYAGSGAYTTGNALDLGDRWRVQCDSISVYVGGAPYNPYAYGRAVLQMDVVGSDSNASSNIASWWWRQLGWMYSGCPRCYPAI